MVYQDEDENVTLMGRITFSHPTTEQCDPFPE